MTGNGFVYEVDTITGQVYGNSGTRISDDFFDSKLKPSGKGSTVTVPLP